MDSLALLNEAHAAGLEVRADGDRLMVRGPRSAAALAQKLLAHKADVLLLFQGTSHAVPYSPSPLADRLLDMPLAQFACEDKLIEVGVGWLEGAFWFVPTVADAEYLVRQGVSRGRIWTAAELMDLMSIPKLTADQVKTIAAVKLEFGGQVIKGRPRGKRCRATLLDYRAAHIQHMQKALHQMNVQLTQVLTDITGTTGLAIIRAIVAGERDPVHLARFRAPRCASSTEDIAKALTGHYQPEHVFALRQALALYDIYTEQVRECDAAIERRFQAIKPVWPNELAPLNRANKHRTHNKNAPSYDARGLLYQLTGVDLVAIPGLNASTVQTILSEIGLDLRKWPNAKAFCAWLGLAPRHEISGGKVWRRGTLKSRNRAGQALRLAAQAAGRSQSGLGAFYRRMRARVGPKAAIVATAHKLARLVYHLLTHRTPFRDLSAEADEQRAREREIATLRKKATRLGLTLVESPA
jgi:transposase